MKTKLHVVFLLTTFLTTYISKAQNPGGVTAPKLWVKANTGLNGTAPTVTSWIDQTATNTFKITGRPTQTAGALNYNPTVAFNGSSYFTGNTSISNTTQAFAVGKIVNTTGNGVTGSGTAYSGLVVRLQIIRSIFSIQKGMLFIASLLHQLPVQFLIH